MNHKVWGVRDQFPYPCFVVGDWKKSVLMQIVALSNDPDVRGICVVIGTAHGYAMEYRISQHDDGTSQGDAWSDLTNSVSTIVVKFDDDLNAALAKIESTWRARDVTETAARDARRGRDMVVFVAVGGRGSYLTCQSPLLGASQYDDLDNLILHIWRAFEGTSE
jgi:hypothetical protein